MSKTMHKAVFLVSNIHCPSCVSYAQDVLHQVPGIKSPIDVSLIEQAIRLLFDESAVTTGRLLEALLDAAFEVRHVTVTDEKNLQTESRDVDVPFFAEHHWTTKWRCAKRKHIQNCDACQKERDLTLKRARTWAAMRCAKNKLPPSPSARSTSTENTLVDRPAVINIDGANEQAHTDQGQYVATISIGGMTCASCSSAITESLTELDFVTSVHVNLIGNCATIAYRGPMTNSDKIIESIENIGYEVAALDSLEQPPKANSGLYKASLSIEGMTCGSCVGTITRGLEALPCISSVNVDLIGAGASVEFVDKDKLEEILQSIKSLGYEANVVSVIEPSASASSAAERTVQIQVDGMYCSHCPERIASALEQFAEFDAASKSFKVSELSTLRHPRITITYKPQPALKLTARDFLSAIRSVDSSFQVSLYHPPSLEERSKKLQDRERWYILRRLVFTGVVAIPTLIIGVVFMMAVPESSPTRIWFDEPIWAGSVMRSEWALMIMTTPVMLYGADMFHKRALKEIWSMWKPRSKVPLHRRFYRFGSMNLLISAATMVAYFSSLAVLIIKARAKPTQDEEHRSSQTYFDTVTFLTFFILIGRFLEAYSKSKTGDAVSALSKMRPSDALLLEDEFKKTPVDLLEVGDAVQIPHGHSPPTDGMIEQDGTFLFDESSLTGESKPVQKIKGDTVYTGTVNMSDPVRIKVTEIGGTSMLDRIINVVREGQAKRAPIERFADLLTGYFVPVITLLAITTWLIWLGLGLSGRLPESWRDVERGGWTFWSLEFAIAVFVVACPCGIGLAAPTALFVGGGLAAKRGILVQGGGEAFQEASRLDTVVFDKTGTLTQGQMKVTAFELVSDLLGEALIRGMTRAMEEVSTHPVAKAVVEHCQDASVEFEHVELHEAPGLGMMGSFVIKNGSNSLTYETAIGNEKLLQSLNESFESRRTNDSDFYLSQLLQKHQLLGQSTAIVAIRRVDSSEATTSSTPFSPVAVFAIADPIRPEAPEVLRSLHDRGLEIHMCTGDNQTTAHAIASQLGIPINNVRAGVLPQDKAAYVTSLQSRAQGKKSRCIVAFVGDGTNDTPALAAADVSIALASGSDVAVTSASFILLNSQLDTILTLVTLSKRVFRRVLMNFAWAAVYNVCLVPVAAGVFFRIGADERHGGFRLSPVWASVAMAASSVSVVLSSLALRVGG